MTSKRKTTDVEIDVSNHQLDLFVNAPPDGDGVKTVDDGTKIMDDSSSDEESVYSGLSELSEDDGIDDIITLKEGSDSESIDDDEEQDENDDRNQSSKSEVTEKTPEREGTSEKSEDRTNDSKDNHQDASTTVNWNTKLRSSKDRSKRREQYRREEYLKRRNKRNQELLDTEERLKGGDREKDKKTSEIISNDDNNTEKVVDEYAFDSSDEEDIRNTIGNVPMEWYQGFDHIGYNVKGDKIIKPPTRDELDEFLNKVDNPDYWRTVFDKKNGEDIVLTDEDLDIIERIQKGKFPETTFDPYEPYIDFFTYEKMIHPVTRRPEHKRSFIPSLTEKDRVSRYVAAMRSGSMKPSWELAKNQKKDEVTFYNIWANDDNPESKKNTRHQSHMTAPKMRHPGHTESYNPPPEYLLTKEEKRIVRAKNEYDEKGRFIPEQYKSLRLVPFYSKFIQERFDRCLDLYLCPRQKKLRIPVDVEDLLPKLPKPKDLQPFPTTLAVAYVGHSSYVRSISVDPTGQWLASGSDDKTVRFWEVSTGRCLLTVEVDGPVQCIAWCPNPAICLVAFSFEKQLHILTPKLGDKLILSGTDKLIQDYVEAEEKKTSPLIEWQLSDEVQWEKGFRLVLTHFKILRQITWHGKGDYFSSVIPEGGHSSVLIHQLSKRRSQNPFRKSKGLVQCTAFHPTRPFFFVATQQHVRVYNLIKQEMIKKLLTNAKWVSSIAVHPGGDNLIIGTYDCKLSWFDMDLSVTPYKTLRHHRQAIRSVCYHKRYPLFASSSDDGRVIVCHGQVYNDLLQNPLIVPVKVLKGHSITNGLGVLCCEFHPNQPWIFSSAADGVIRLFS